MTEYQRMGNGGTRAATIIVNQSAMCYFEKSKYVFLSDRRTTYSFRDLERVGDSFMLPPGNLVEKAAKVAEASTTA